jgi:hypothetical protein
MVSTAACSQTSSNCVSPQCKKTSSIPVQHFHCRTLYRAFKERRRYFKCQYLLRYCIDFKELGVIKHTRVGSLLFNVYRNNPRIVEELKEKITAIVANISGETLMPVTKNFSQRLQTILDAQELHIQYVFTSIINSHLSCVPCHQIH